MGRHVDRRSHGGFGSNESWSGRNAGGHGRNSGYGGGVSSAVGGLAGLAKRMTWGVAMIGVVVVSIAAVFGFLLVDPALNLLASLMGVAMTNGKEAAALFGVGDLAGIAIDGAKASELPAQLLSLLSVVLKPLIVVMWVLGVAVLLALPIIASKLAAAGRRLRG